MAKKTKKPPKCKPTSGMAAITHAAIDSSGQRAPKYEPISGMTAIDCAWALRNAISKLTQYYPNDLPLQAECCYMLTLIDTLKDRLPDYHRDY